MLGRSRACDPLPHVYLPVMHVLTACLVGAGLVNHRFDNIYIGDASDSVMIAWAMRGKGVACMFLTNTKRGEEKEN